MEVVDYAMHGFVLIGAWCTRTVLNSATELVALSAVPGLALRVGTSAKALCGWVSALGAAAPAGGNANAGVAPQPEADTDQVDDSTLSESAIGDDDDNPSDIAPSPTSEREKELIEVLDDAHQTVIDVQTIMQTHQQPKADTPSGSSGD